MQASELIVSLTARIDAYYDSADSAGVLSDDALAEAVALSRQADDDAAVPPEVLSEFYWSRFLARRQRFHASGGLANLDAALAAVTDVVGAGQPGADSLGEVWALESELRRDRFTIGGDRDDLNRAVDVGRRAIAATTDQRYLAVRLSLLADALAARYAVLSDPADLSDEVDTRRRIADCTGAEDSDRATVLGALGAALRQRFERTGDIHDLDQAVLAFQQSLDATPMADRDHRFRTSVLIENSYVHAEQAARRREPSEPPRAVARGEPLVLRTTQVVDDDNWTWELCTDDQVVATTRVSLGEEWRREPFRDLSGYLSHYSVPSLDPDYLRDMLTSVGTWVTAQVLGPELAEAIAARLPATVTVRLNPRQSHLLGAPLEIAQVAGRPLASRGVTFSFAVGGGQPRTSPAQVRILAVYPLPSDAAALGLRAERLAIERIAAQAAATGRPVALTSLQYGVTRHGLRATLATATWDIVHVGGHGAHSGLLLEGESGGQDFVTNDELVEMLRPLRGRIRLVVLGTCNSGANQAARLLGRFGGEAGALWRAVARDEPGDLVASERAYGLASRIARDLQAVTVAMRFAVDDRFARDYATYFYEGLLLHGLPVDAACARALARTRAAVHDDDAHGLLAELTPVVYCPDNAGVALLAVGPLDRFEVTSTLNGPATFVGRSALLTRMSELVGPRGSAPAVLLTGASGIGKSACVEEFVSTVGPAFEHVIRLTVGTGDTPADAVTPLLDQILATAPAVPSPAADDDAGWPRAGRILRGGSLLVVIDSLDAVLTPDGQIPDSWQAAVDALTGHGGPSKTVFTARRGVASLERSDGCVNVRIGALTSAEAVLLVAQLPRLGRMLRAVNTAVPPRGNDLTVALAQALATAGGHPGMLIALDALGYDLQRLNDAIRDVRQLAGRERDARRYGPQWDRLLEADRWSRSALAALSDDQMLLVRLVAVLAPQHEQLTLIRLCWPVWWDALGRGDEPPVLETLVEQLIAASILTAQAGVTAAAPPPDPSYLLGPLIGTQLNAAEEDVAARDAVLNTVAEFFVQLWWHASVDPLDGRQASEHSVAYLGAKAAASLLTAGRTEEALRVLYSVAGSGSSTAMAKTVAVMASETVQKAANLREEVLAFLVEGTALAHYARDDARPRLMAAYTIATSRPELVELAILVGIRLMGFLLDGAELEAFDVMADQVNALVESAQTVDSALPHGIRYEHMRSLLLREQPLRVLDEAEAVIAALSETPPVPDPADSRFAQMSQWATRNAVLDGAVHSATVACGVLRRWEDQLRYADRLWRARAQRRAPATEVVGALIFKVQALMNLSRLDEASGMLDTYQRLAAGHEDAESLKMAVTFRMVMDLVKGRYNNSITDINEQMLAVRYSAGEGPLLIGAAHMQAGGGAVASLTSGDGEFDEETSLPFFIRAGAHILAGIALLYAAGQRETVTRALSEFGWILDVLYEEGETPDTLDFAWIDGQVNVDPDRRLPFAQFLRRLASTPEKLAALATGFREMLENACGEAEADTGQSQRALEQARTELAPLFEATLAAARGDHQARQQVEEVCQQWEDNGELQPWAAVFRILADRQDASNLFEMIGLNGVSILMPLIQQLRPAAFFPD